MPNSSTNVTPTSKTSAESPQAASQTQTTNEDKNEKKPTVLETHGYFLGKTIGTGSYATVRVARSERHGYDVAVKIVSKFSAPPDYLKKFLPREIEVVKGLRHPNLIRFLQAIETTHRVYIVMEYAENGSLLDIIRKDQCIDEVRARKWFRQLIEAIDYCHERGVVHRDIKCENMLMDSGWNVKLSDFGFARGHLKPKNGVMPLSETFCGSYAYASPEILRGIPYQPQYADVWSTGVVLFAMVYGRLPFDDSNYRELIKQVSNKVVFPKDPKVSPNCKFLINKILAPLKSRIRINGIRNDQWFNYGDKEKTSRESTSSEAEAKRQTLLSDVENMLPPRLITKENLNKAAIPRDKDRKNSTDDETPIDAQIFDTFEVTDSEENASTQTPKPKKKLEKEKA